VDFRRGFSVTVVKPQRAAFVETLFVVNDVEKGGLNRSGGSKRAESCKPFIEVSLAIYDVETDLARKSRETKC
jgi:hypothetical protein